VRDAAAAAGYRAAVTFLNGRVSDGVDPFRIPRFAMRADLDPTRLALWLARPLDSWGAHQADVVLDGGPAAPLAQRVGPDGPGDAEGSASTSPASPTTADARSDRRAAPSRPESAAGVADG
jgi:hypothetical protein